MENIFFSVIIPLYNKENTILNTIQSVINQKFLDFELVVVNDGSTDNSLEIAQTIQDKRIRIIHKENGGVSSARNLGIKESKGKYICFLDGDDYWEDNYLQVVYNLFKKYPECRIACPSYKVSYGTRVVYPKFKGVNMNEDCIINDFFEMATSPFWVCNSSCIAIERSIFNEIDYWFPENETVYEDFDLWIRIGVNNKIAHSSTVCCTYNRAADNNSRKNHSKKIVYSKTYINTLNELLLNDVLTNKQKEYVHEIKDRRMVPYIFSLINVGRKKEAKLVLKTWNVTNKYRGYKRTLYLLSLLPTFLIDSIQWIRIKVF